MTAVRPAEGSASLPPDADGSLLIANLDTSAIHRVDRVGAAIWSAIDGTRDAAGIAAVAAESLGIEQASRFAEATAAFLETLVTLGLVDGPLTGGEAARCGATPGADG